MGNAIAEDGPRLVIYCRSSRWWGQIRQARWVETPARGLFVPRVEALLELSRGSSREFVILELPETAPESALELVHRLAGYPRRRTVVCLALPEQAGCEFAFREAGAGDVLWSVADFPRLHRAVEFFIRSFVPAPWPWEQQLMQQLPWRSFS